MTKWKGNLIFVSIITQKPIYFFKRIQFVRFCNTELIEFRPQYIRTHIGSYQILKYNASFWAK